MDKNSFRVSAIVIPTERRSEWRNPLTIAKGIPRLRSLKATFTRDDSQKLLSIFGHVETFVAVTLNELSYKLKQS